MKLLGPALSGLAALLVVVFTAPGVIDIDVGGADQDVAMFGVHGSERDHNRRFRWTDGAARVTWPGAFGVAPSRVEVEVASFINRAGDQVELAANGRTLRHRFSDGYDVVQIPVTSTGEVVVDVRSATYDARPDPRALGVRLDRVTIVNAPIGQRLRALDVVAALAVLAVGAAAWCFGLVLGGAMGPPWRAVAGVVTLAVVTSVLCLWRDTMLTPHAARALGAAIGLGIVQVRLLRRRDAASPRAAALIGTTMALVWCTVAVWMSHYFVDVLRWDIWEAVPFVQRILDGTWRPADFVSFQNEHIPLTVRLAILANVRLAHWNHWIEYALTLGVAAGYLTLLTAFVASTTTRASRVPPAVLPVIALIVCSAAQWENWLRGFHVHILIGAVAPIAALLVLCRADGWKGLASAVALGVVGMLSFGTAIVVWPLGVVVLLLRRPPRWTATTAAWSLASAVVLGIYLSAMPRAATPPEVTWEWVTQAAAGWFVALSMPVAYVPVYLVPPEAALHEFPARAAMIGLAVLAWLVWDQWRRDTDGQATWVFPTVLALFGVAACAAAAIARVPFGLHAMTASRYIVFSGCFWIGLVMLMGMSMARVTESWRTWPWRLGIVVVAVAAAWSWTPAAPFVEADATDGRRAREQMRRGDFGHAAAVLYPDPYLIVERAAVLSKHRLSVYRAGAR